MPQQQGRPVYALSPSTHTAYKECLILEGIPSKQHPYYVMRANQFIRAAAGRDPAGLTAHEIEEILERSGRDSKLADWQFAQMVDAVRVLLNLCLRSTASMNVDWSFWQASAHGVKGDHATTGREHPPQDLAYLRMRKSTAEYAVIRKQHRDLLIRLVTEIRARGYAYRTEEAYEQWTIRYIAFCKGASPEETGADHVATFLHDLVVSGNVSASTQNQALNALIFLYKQVL